MSNPPKKRIAVLGGGMASLSAVFALTNVPNWDDQLDITVYQMGWRLGGKCASGRNMDAHCRIEEHGLHVWGGFYENAFWMIKKVYQELNRPPGVPFRTWQDAFTGQDTFFLKETGWDFWSFCLPTCKNGTPGFDNTALPTSVRDVVFIMLDAIQDWFEDLMNPASMPSAAVTPGSLIDVARTFLEGQLALVRDALRNAADGITDFLSNVLAGGLELVRSAVKLLLQLDPRYSETIRRHRWMVADYLLTTLIGILADNLLTRSFDDAISDIEYGVWLRSHGLSPETWASPLIHAMYDLVFAYPDGEFGLDKRNADAASMLKVTLQIMRYRGSSIYRMAGGMGDMVVAPIYLVLKARGVKFKFFQTVTNLKLSPDLTRIDRIDMVKQVALKDEVAGYEPLVDVKGLPCWLSEPRYDQIVNGSRLKTLIDAGQVNLEAPDSRWDGDAVIDLQVGRDYDEILFGISIGAIPYICGELLQADVRWRQMIQAVKTIPTQSLQLWLKPTLQDLGWMKVPPDFVPTTEGILMHLTDCKDDQLPPCDEKFRAQPPMVGGIYSAPTETMDTWIAMDQLIPLECHPTGTVGTIVYLTGLLNVPRGAAPAHPIDHAAALAAVRANVDHFLRTIAPSLWTDQAGTLGALPTWIVDSYVRANTQPSDLYVLSVAGSKKYRLSCQQKHFGNLWIAGDWTRCGLDLGYVEAAITSGLLAARALLKDAQIPGYAAAIAGGDDYYWLNNA